MFLIALICNILMSAWLSTWTRWFQCKFWFKNSACEFVRSFTNSHEKWGLWSLALMNFMLNGNGLAVEHELFVFR